MDIGDRARVLRTEETERLGLADLEGDVHGWTTPSQTGVDVIGTDGADHAVAVHFAELGKQFWFAASLLEDLGPALGTTMWVEGMDGELVLTADGWTMQPRKA